MAKQKIHSTTQDFTEIVDIADDVVFFKGKNACMVIETSSVNFFLLSNDEQNARIYGYMSLINSLSFPIQIMILSRRVDLSNYVKILEQKIDSVANPRIKDQLSLYKEFIQDLIKGEGLLDKKTYIVVPFSSLELGATSTVKDINKKAMTFTEQVKTILMSKVSNVATQVERMGLMAKPLGTDELSKLFYELYNQDFFTFDFDSNDVKNVIL